MPIYEFFCSQCHSKTSFLVKSVSSPLEPKCSICGNMDLARTVSTFAHHKSLKTIHQESGEPTMFPGQDYYKDPRNIGRWAEKKFQDAGIEMPSEIQQKIQAAREGEMPEQLKDLKGASADTSYH